MQVRRTQAERSRKTQRKILDVTLTCLLEQGLRDTSTVDVAHRAGVSRGALLHHYPSKDLLLKEALRHLLRDEIREVRQMAEGVDSGEIDFDAFLANLWERFSGPMYMITLEFVTAARTDPVIKAALVPVALEYNASLDEIWEQLLLRSSSEPRDRRLALNVTLCFLRGMGTQSVWRDDPQLFHDMLDFWKQTLETAGILKNKDQKG
ncbi:TetR/AcrR family transcriptional regulator [Limibacillus halophilus]|uniref:AcrR family transcriptional regulator n=1 Tax=Limibacillus halophilus TaxID=1579333 RepID=A0A839SNZ5_9PROT|nr:TetR/AcrR family transcriptional regulator [Limibacillus halophilus]MBB3064172.1 AcrR family transcriptional regulator [Limibacillus halophilus]